MKSESKTVLIYTGDLVTVEHIKTELESQGISCLVKNSFQQGLEAGFVAGVPNAIDIYVVSEDKEKALEIVNTII